MNPRIFLAVAISAIFIGFTPVQAKEILYIHNTYSGTISKIAIPEHEVIGEIEIGFYMDYVTKSPDGSTLYVNRIEGLGVGRARNIGEEGELIAIDPRTDEIKWKVHLDGMPHHPSVSKDGKLVFVPFYDTWWLAVVDTEKKEVIKKIFIGHGGHGTKLSADGERLYVGSMMNDLLTVIDTEKLEVVDLIGFRDAVRPFAITEDEKWAYVQQSWLHGFLKVNLETKEKEKFELPTMGKELEPPEFYPHNVNHGIALTHNEDELWANGSVLDFVAVYSHPELELKETIPVGDDPNAVIFSPDGKYAYVSNRGSDNLSVIDTETYKEIKRIELGKYPQRMVIIDVPDGAVDTD